MTVLSCKYRSQVRLRSIDLLIFVWLYFAFIPGHFHLTIGVAVALSYVGIVYWLIPYLERRELWSPRAALVQTFLYFFGVMIFSHGLMAGGIEEIPRSGVGQDSLRQSNTPTHRQARSNPVRIGDHIMPPLRVMHIRLTLPAPRG